MSPAALARIHAACFTVPRPWSAAEFAETLAATGVVLEACDKGFALARQVAGEAEILTLAVLPEDRRRGVATALLDRLLARLAADGAQTVFLEVAADTAAARGLYGRAGFSEVGRRAGYFSGTDALILRKAL